MKGNPSGAVLCLSLLLALPVVSPAQPAAPQQQPPAPPPAAPAKPNAGPPKPSEPQTGETALSLEIFYWLSHGHPDLRTGSTNQGPNPSDLSFPSKSKGVPGVVLSIPAGRENSLRFSYFRASVARNTTAPQDVTVFSTAYNKGDYVESNYILNNIKISYDYLSYPFPVRGSKFRFRTLWEAQYTSISSTFNAPLKPTSDSAGNLIINNTQGSKTFIYPSFGVGVGYVPSPRLRLEAKASGFWLPHRPSTWDAQGTLNYRFRRVEVALGAKVFHFKTSPKSEQFFQGTLFGPYLGLRLFPFR